MTGVYEGIVVSTSSAYPFNGNPSVMIECRSILLGQRPFTAEIAWGRQEAPPTPGTKVVLSVQFEQAAS